MACLIELVWEGLAVEAGCVDHCEDDVVSVEESVLMLEVRFLPEGPSTGDLPRS